MHDAPEMVSVPPELRHQRLEVIFWPLEETVKPTHHSRFTQLAGGNRTG